MHEKPYIFFDLDGTLTDPVEGITNAVAYALAKWDIMVEDKKTLTPFIGPPLAESFQRFYGFSEANAALCVQYYREYFPEKGIYENRIYEGIPELLAMLQQSGKKLVLATSKPAVYAVRILEQFQLSSYFAFVSGSELDGTRVKKADVIAYALVNCDIDNPEQVVMVGDREHDVIGAHAMGIKCIGVLYGYGDKHELTKAKADMLVSSVEELSGVLGMKVSS